MIIIAGKRVLATFDVCQTPIDEFLTVPFFGGDSLENTVQANMASGSPNPDELYFVNIHNMSVCLREDIIRLASEYGRSFSACGRDAACAGYVSQSAHQPCRS